MVVDTPEAFLDLENLVVISTALLVQHSGIYHGIDSFL